MAAEQWQRQRSFRILRCIALIDCNGYCVAALEGRAWPLDKSIKMSCLSKPLVNLTLLHCLYILDTFNQKHYNEPKLPDIGYQWHTLFINGCLFIFLGQTSKLLYGLRGFYMLPTILNFKMPGAEECSMHFKILWV